MVPALTEEAERRQIIQKSTNKQDNFKEWASSGRNHLGEIPLIYNCFSVAIMSSLSSQKPVLSKCHCLRLISVSGVLWEVSSSHLVLTFRKTPPWSHAEGHTTGMTRPRASPNSLASGSRRTRCDPKMTPPTCYIRDGLSVPLTLFPR